MERLHKRCVKGNFKVIEFPIEIVCKTIIPQNTSIDVLFQVVGQICTL